MWTNTSFEPSSGWINPYPFWALNHFTVPLAIVRSFKATRPPSSTGGGSDLGTERRRVRRSIASWGTHTNHGSRLQGHNLPSIPLQEDCTRSRVSAPKGGTDSRRI